MIKETNEPCNTQFVMHILLTELDFTKCEDGKYRRCMIHDFMSVKIDEYGHMWVSAECDYIEIQITMIKFKNRDRFKDWLLFTYGS